MKINVLAIDVFIWTNQIRVKGESARASFWLATRRWTRPPPHACKTQRNRAKTASAGKINTELYISDYFGNFCPTYTTSHLDIWQSVFLHIPMYVSLWTVICKRKSLFTGLQCFWPYFGEKNVPKVYARVRMLIIFILCQHEVAVSQNMNYTSE